MANEDDEFGFKSLAEAFKPEVVRQEVATTKAAQAVPPVVSQPVPTRPVTPRAATPSLPEIKPEEVAASVPQMQVPELPPIQNPVFNPEFQKAAGIAALPAALGGAALGAGAAYGLYKGRKSIQDRSIGKPMTAPADFGGNLGKQLQGMDMSRVSPSDLKLLQEYEAKRVARQTAVQPEINKQMGFAQPSGTTLFPTNPVSPQTPPTIQAEVETPKITLPETPGSVAKTPVQPAPVAPYSQERMAGMLAGQEMANPLGGQASAYTEPLKAVEPPTDKLITGTGREVVAGQGPVKKKFAREYATPLDVPKGYVFLPEGQYIDVLRNDLGQQTYTEQFKNRPFPTDYEKAVQSAKDINRELNRPTREELKASGAAMPEPTPGITKKVGPGKKVVVGGIAGSLLTLADVANAATAKEAAQSIGEALLPIGITPSQAGAPVLPPSVLAAQKRQMEEMQKLGSPYRKR